MKSLFQSKTVASLFGDYILYYREPHDFALSSYLPSDISEPWWAVTTPATTVRVPNHKDGI